MFFLTRAGVSTSGVPAHFIGTSQTNCHQIQAKQESNSEPDITNKKTHSNSFFSRPTPLKLLKATLTTAILSFAVVKSPSLVQHGISQINKLFNNAASPTRSQDILTLKQEIPEELKSRVWGKEGLVQKSIIQRKENCQIIANLLASTFTEERKRRLDSLVNVTDYNLDKNNFYINFTVNINSKRIPVSYTNLTTDVIDLKNANDPLAPHALAYAIEKELTENYLPNPSGYTALSTATFITNKSYSTLHLSDISDSSLIEILKETPNEIITVRTHKIPKNSRVYFNHEYAVKSYRHENGQDLITLLTTHNEEITLKLSDLRKNIITITAPTSTFKLIDEETLEVYLLSLLALIALWKITGKSETKLQTSQADLKLQPINCQS